MIRGCLLLIFGCLFILSGCKKADKGLFLHDAAYTGIKFENTLTPTPDLNILTYLYYYNGAGVATGDYNNDGLPDLYFVGNQVADQLYLNEGNFKFREVTSIAQINNAGGFSTGVTNVDINADGLLDIYVCKVGSHQTLQDPNKLFLNTGVNDDGVPQFREAAIEYGLDVIGYSTHASFFDADLDGDLDLYLLNHSVHPNRSYGKGKIRSQYDPFSGDRYFRNEGGTFKDVSGEIGIFQGKIGYGLDMSVGDLNNDGWPDIYIGNDFFENDYLYMNQRDGSFKEIITSDLPDFGHSSHFSMGNAIADLTNDGLAEIFELDMLPQDLLTYKNSGPDERYPIYQYYLRNDYAPQYMQNTLQHNNGNGSFSEIAHLAGLAATNWSWSILPVDLDRNGYKDLFITNGIKGATNDMDFVSFAANDEIQKQISDGGDANLVMAEKLPPLKIANYVYSNHGDNVFEDKSTEWLADLPTYSNGSTYADLDNDGDMDLVINDVDGPALVYENRLNQDNHYIGIRLKGPPLNAEGIGARVMLYHDGHLQTWENYPANAYLSYTDTRNIFGLDETQTVDSLIVVWPGGKLEVFKSLLIDQYHTFQYENAAGGYYGQGDTATTANVVSLEFTHREEMTLEFDRNPLLPFAKSNEGPSVSVADVDGDGLDDIFIGGAKWQASALFLQTPTADFKQSQAALFEASRKSEDTDHVFFDADSDGDQDLLVVSGGNEFQSGIPLKPRLYLNEAGLFTRDSVAFQSVEANASVVKTLDFDNDGDLDVFIGSNTVPEAFGETGKSFLMANMGGGIFVDVTEEWAEELVNPGQIEDAFVVDIDGDDDDDLILVGDWMPVTIMVNDQGNFRKLHGTGMDQYTGWWNTVTVQDFDNDGDLDILAGNWGLNSRLKASEDYPVTLYRRDFDGNGSVETVLSYFYGGQETTLATKDELVRQLSGLNKKFLSYREFAKASMSELFGEEALAKADRQQVTELASCYFENEGNGKFKKRQLPTDAQVAPIHDILVEDFDSDGLLDVLLVGNTFEISTQLARQDALKGQVLMNKGAGQFEGRAFSTPIYGPARDIEKLKIAGEKYLIVTMNNGKPIILKSNWE